MVNFGRRFHPEPGQNCTPVHTDVLDIGEWLDEAMTKHGAQGVGCGFGFGQRDLEYELNGRIVRVSVIEGDEVSS